MCVCVLIYKSTSIIAQAHNWHMYHGYIPINLDVCVYLTVGPPVQYVNVLHALTSTDSFKRQPRIHPLQVVTYYADETGYHPTITYLPARAPHSDPVTSLPAASPTAPPSGTFGARLLPGKEGDAGDSSEDGPVGLAGSSYSRYFIREDKSDEVAAPGVPATSRGFHVLSPSRRVSAFARGGLEPLDILRRESAGQSPGPSVARGVPLAQAVAAGRRRTPSASNFVRRFEVVPAGSLKGQSRVGRLLAPPALAPA